MDQQKPKVISDKIPGDLKCPLSGVLMKNPVVAPDGICYDRQYIEKWLRIINLSPDSGMQMNDKRLVEAKYFKNKILKFKQQYPELYAQAYKQQIDWNVILKRKIAFIFQIEPKKDSQFSSQKYQLNKSGIFSTKIEEVNNQIQQYKRINSQLSSKINKAEQKIESLKLKNIKLDQKYDILQSKFKKSMQKLFQFYSMFKKILKDKFIQQLKQTHKYRVDQAMEQQIQQKKQKHISQSDEQENFSYNSPKNIPKHFSIHDNGITQDNSGKEQHQIKLKNFQQKVINFLNILQRAKQDTSVNQDQRMVAIEQENFKYLGQMKEGKRHGLGILTQKDGSFVYQGYFKQGCIQGFGRLSNKDGKYIGDLKDGLYQGFGKLQVAKGKLVGSKYVGEFQKGSFEGFGILNYGENGLGRIYQGYWKKNRQHGYGKLLMPGNTYYFGTFFRGKKHGQVNYVNKRQRVERKYFERGVMKSLTVMRQKKMQGKYFGQKQVKVKLEE